jgi:hypothetical protein
MKKSKKSDWLGPLEARPSGCGPGSTDARANYRTADFPKIDMQYFCCTNREIEIRCPRCRATPAALEMSKERVPAEGSECPTCVQLEIRHADLGDVTSSTFLVSFTPHSKGLIKRGNAHGGLRGVGDHWFLSPISTVQHHQDIHLTAQRSTQIVKVCVILTC